VTDFGGIEGKGFGYAFDPVVWDTIKRAENTFGIEGKYFESKTFPDFETNLQKCKDWGAKLIFAVSYKWEMADAVDNAAIENPQIYYASVDWSSGNGLPNYKGMGFAWDQGTFLAGYLSAAMTKTGKVGTFAGMMGPVIQQILDGYYLGVNYYNQQKNTNIKLLGHDPSQPDSTYLIGNWTSLESASGMLDTLIAGGADVFLPVCGYVAVESVFKKHQETGVGIAIGTDYDMSQIYPEYSSVVLASVVKRPDVMVFELIRQVAGGEWSDEENYLLSLNNGGLALVYGKDWINKIPANVKDDMNFVIAKIKDGLIETRVDRQ
jgi:basic membrane protein A